MCNFNFIIILTSLIFLDNLVGSLNFQPILFLYKYIYVYIIMYGCKFIHLAHEYVPVYRILNALFSDAGLKTV